LNERVLHIYVTHCCDFELGEIQFYNIVVWLCCSNAVYKYELL